MKAIIIGAGTCGLASALAIARQGWRVEVLERRRDPMSPQGRRVTRARERLLKSANAALRSGEAATRAFEKAHALGASQWGSRAQIVILDTHSLRFLSGLGVDVSRFPMLRTIDVSLGLDLPALCVRFDERTAGAASAELDPEGVIMQRDLAAQPTIFQLEESLRRAVEKEPEVRVTFGAEATAREEASGEVTVTYAENGSRRVSGQLLVIADGGGEKSFSRLIGIPRAQISKESLQFAVFRTKRDEQPLRGAAREAFGHWSMSREGWTALLGNGEVVTVGIRRGRGPSSDSSAHVHGKRGHDDAELLEPMSAIDCGIDRATRFTDGRRTVLAGDAAIRGTPVFALGVQYALLWAKMCADMAAASQRGEGTLPKLHSYALRGEQVARQRLDFESASNAFLDHSSTGARALSEVAASEEVLSRIRDVRIDFRARGGGGLLRLKVAVELGDLGELGCPEMMSLRPLGSTELEAVLDLSFENEVATARLTPACPLRIRTEIETILICAGTLSLEHCDASYWEIRCENVLAHRVLNSKGQPADGSTQSISTPIECFRLQLPDAFIDAAAQCMPARLARLGIIEAEPFIAEIEFRSGKIMDWGTFRVRLGGEPRMRLTLSKSPTGRPRLSLEMLRGFGQPIEFTRFARRTPLRVSRWIGALSRLTGGTIDGLIDGWAALLGSMVRRVDFDLREDGSAIATYASVLSVPFMLSARDVSRLRGDLFSSRALAGLMAQYQHGVTGVGAQRERAREA